MCLSWLLWVLGPSSSLSLSLSLSLSFSVPLSTILFPVTWFCVVFRVFVCALFWCVVFRNLLVFPAFSELNLSLLWAFFPLCFGVCLFCLFWVFLGWLVSSGYWFGCILVPVPSFVSGVICLPSVISYLRLQNPTYRYWCWLLAVSASVGTGVLLLCILFVFTEIALVQSGSHLCWGPPYLLLSLPPSLLLLLPLPPLDLLLWPYLTVVLCFRLSFDICSFVSLRHYQLLHDQ